MSKHRQQYISSIQDRNKRMNAILFSRAVDEIIPRVYAGFVMTLHTRFGVDYEDIVYALRDTQRYWQEGNIVQKCKEVTGIDVMSEETAEEEGEEGWRI